MYDPVMQTISVAIGDVFVTSTASYTVESVKGQSVKWKCTGKTIYYKQVNLATILQWLNEGRLKQSKLKIKINPKNGTLSSTH